MKWKQRSVAARHPSLELTTNSQFTLFLFCLFVCYSFLLTTKTRLISSYFQKFLARIFSRIRTWLKCHVCRRRTTTARNRPRARRSHCPLTRWRKIRTVIKAKEIKTVTLRPVKIMYNSAILFVVNSIDLYRLFFSK